MQIYIHAKDISKINDKYERKLSSTNLTRRNYHGKLQRVESIECFDFSFEEIFHQKTNGNNCAQLSYFSHHKQLTVGK